MTCPKYSLSAGLLAALLCGLLSPAALADKLPLRGPLPFAAYDRNENGSISEKEFAALRRERMEARIARARARVDTTSARAFERMDADGNGQLSSEELEAGQKSRRERHKGMAMDCGPGRGMTRQRPAFAAFDLDADGGIVEEEFYTVRNNRIRERMAQGRRMRHLPQAPTFADLDSDGDGKISAAEFAGHQPMMHRWGRH